MKPNAQRNAFVSGLWGAAVRLGLLLAGLVWMAGSIHAAVWVDLPEITMSPNRADQVFVVYMNVTEEPVEVMGIAFNLQVEDGGSAAGGVVEGPAITAVDLLSGTVFESNSNGLTGTGSIVPQVYEEGTLTIKESITLEPGLWKVATVTLDTTRFSSGTYRLTLDTRNGPTRYTTLGGDLMPVLMDGEVSLVPEPGFWGWASGAALLWLAGVRRIRRCVRRHARAALLILLISGAVGIGLEGQAAVSIDVPEILLAPNQAGQSFEVHVQNDGNPVPVTGIGFNLQVADGGVPAGGRIQGPAITSVDVIAGTIFASNNNGLSGAGSMVPQVYERGTLTASDTVNLPSGRSKLATVVLDTTGFDSGTFTLTLNTVNDRTQYTTLSGNLRPTLVNGSVTVAPRPSVTAIVRHTPLRIALTFGTAVGARYRVQRAAQIATPDWANLPHALAVGEPLALEAQSGTGSALTVFVESPAGGSGFYRIRMEPGGS